MTGTTGRLVPWSDLARTALFDTKDRLSKVISVAIYYIRKLPDKQSPRNHKGHFLSATCPSETSIPSLNKAQETRGLEQFFDPDFLTVKHHLYVTDSLSLTHQI